MGWCLVHSDHQVFRQKRNLLDELLTGIAGYRRDNATTDIAEN